MKFKVGDIIKDRETRDICEIVETCVIKGYRLKKLRDNNIFTYPDFDPRGYVESRFILKKIIDSPLYKTINS